VSDDLIRIEGVTKRFGSVVAVDDVTLPIRENEFFGLLGPSGCGKTTLLRILAGFEHPDEGRILLDGADLTRTKPYRRPVNMMFQSYALFPHMTVERNVAYGLRMEGLGKREALTQAHEALELVQLSDLAKRRPAQLSGGQEQRVALARALVKRPRVLLLDEPLSALDRQIRAEMQIELKLLQHSVGITFVVVTHDQEEALTMADRIAVMNAGRVEQVGAPDDLYDSPATTFVARFIGDSNLFPGTVGTDGAGPALISPDGTWRVDAASLDRSGLGVGAAAAVLVRPERLRIAPQVAAGDVSRMDNVVSGVLVETVFLGATRKYLVELAPGRSLQVRSSSDERLDVEPGAPVVVGWDRDAGVVVAG
jgi:spermidine/putrescine ABC transporter ATP-binding subunit